MSQTLRQFSSLPPIRVADGCVVSYCPMASAVGSSVLYRGGNAVDAAVATGLALAVSYPQAGNLGGGGFLLLHRANGEVHYLDYRETAPRKLDPVSFLGPQNKDRSTVGGLAIGVPGTIAGFADALARFGTWSWEQVVAPAIELADRGVWLTIRQAAFLRLYHGALKQFPSTQKYFTSNGETMLPATLFRQPVLAKTLRSLTEEGPRAFYEGEIAERIVQEVAAQGGVLDREDLRSYRPQWRKPLRRSFGGKDVYTTHLPSAGGLILQLCLGLLESDGALEFKPGSIERFERVARAFRVAFGLRQALACDPDDLDDSERARIDALAEKQMSSGDLERFEQELKQITPVSAAGGTNTTHFCVMDRDGNAVSNTYSLNTMFGSKVAVDGAGFILNNSIDDFSLSPEATNWYSLGYGARNHVKPGRRPVSSMTPTIVSSGGHAELVVGGSGGPRIPTMVAQTIVGVVSDGIPLGEVMRAPRIHHQFFPDELALEQAMPSITAEGLERYGFTIQRQAALGMGAAIHRPPGSENLLVSLDARFGMFE